MKERKEEPIKNEGQRKRERERERERERVTWNKLKHLQFYTKNVCTSTCIL